MELLAVAHNSLHQPLVRSHLAEIVFPFLYLIVLRMAAFALGGSAESPASKISKVGCVRRASLPRLQDFHGAVVVQA